MRITDVIFFGLLSIMMLVVLVVVAFGIDFPQWVAFWWVLLIPVVLVKMIFPRSKVTRWLEKTRW
jgi:hypothetical protein